MSNIVDTMPARHLVRQQHVHSLPLVLTVYDLNDNEVKREYLDYGIKDDRAYIGRISLWAMQNHMVVEVMAKADFKE